MPINARELFSQPNVDGGLVGGASLKSEEFHIDREGGSGSQIARRPVIRTRLNTALDHSGSPGISFQQHSQ
jgi:hypothetical protein